MGEHRLSSGALVALRLRDCPHPLPEPWDTELGMEAPGGLGRLLSILLFLQALFHHSGCESVPLQGPSSQS